MFVTYKSGTNYLPAYYRLSPVNLTILERGKEYSHKQGNSIGDRL